MYVAVYVFNCLCMFIDKTQYNNIQFTGNAVLESWNPDHFATLTV